MLEQNVEKILSTVSDESDRGLKIRLLLEKLLNYAISESKSIYSEGDQNDLNSSTQTFKFPQDVLDELEELGVNVLMLIDGIIDQYTLNPLSSPFLKLK